jgi:glycosyltransferase involved in cell wall biosynthesis
MNKIFRRHIYSEKTLAGRLFLKLNRRTTIFLLNTSLRVFSRNSNAKANASEQRVLYLAASAAPYHATGYTSRTQALLQSLQSLHSKLYVITRPGYPWDRNDRLCDPAGHTTCIDNIEYRHFAQGIESSKILRYILACQKVIELFVHQNGITAIHAASNHVNALPALFLAKRLGIPFTYEMRGLWELSRISRQPDFKHTNTYKLGLDLERLVALSADHVFVISDQLGRYITKHFGVPENRISLLPNCSDIKQSIEETEDRVEAGLIVYAGALVVYEGLDTLLQAIAILNQGGVFCRLKIAGQGEMRGYLESMVQALGIKDQVVFLGRISSEQARELISRSSLVCIPRKPFEVCNIVPPLKLVEAMSLGKPVVVPDLPVFRDELGEKPVGLFFCSGDSKDLARVLRQALESPDEMHAMGLRARAYVESNRTWEPYARNLIERITDLTGN